MAHVPVGSGGLAEGVPVPAEVYAVVDLYGQCVQVSLTGATGPADNSLATSSATEKTCPLPSPGRGHRGDSGGGGGDPPPPPHTRVALVSPRLWPSMGWSPPVGTCPPPM